ncbi:MAG: hypothetical protein Q9213_006929 [Squamulea squamosa]
MKLSAFFIAITQITLAMSANDVRPSADDERGTIPATQLASNNLDTNNTDDIDNWNGVVSECEECGHG